MGNHGQCAAKQTPEAQTAVELPFCHPPTHYDKTCQVGGSTCESIHSPHVVLAVMFPLVVPLAWAASGHDEPSLISSISGILAG